MKLLLVTLLSGLIEYALMESLDESLMPAGQRQLIILKVICDHEI